MRQTEKALSSHDGMDIAICTFEPGTNELQFAEAYNPLYCIRNNELIEYKGDKMPIGIHRKDNIPFTLHSINLEKDDTFYIFTDGFVDQISSKTKRKYLSKNFKKLLLDIHQKPFNEQNKILETTFDEWRGNYDQMDDMLIFGFKIFVQ